MSTLTLYGNRFSGHSYKVRLALMLGDVSHDYRHIDLSVPRAERPDDFRAASRFGQVPALVVDGVPMVQSNAILQWLAESEGVLAVPPGARQAVREWLCWEAARLGNFLPKLRWQRRFVAEPDATLVAWLEGMTREDLALLDATLAERPFLVGTQPSVADVSCAGYLWWLDQAGLDIRDWPHIGAWLERLSALPGWQHPDELMAPDIPD